MKPFNLEEAINGKAFYLENGYRGVIKYCVDDLITQFEQPPHYPYVGYVLDNKGFLFTTHTAWNKNGKSNEYPSFNAATMVDDTPPQDKQDKGQTMKPFDLKEALSGKPVKLRNGMKALICYRIPDEYVFDDGSSAAFPLHGIIFNKQGNLEQIAEIWGDDGSYSNGSLHKFDIIGMWEDIIDIKDLPKAFTPKKGETYYYIHPHETNFYLDIHETTCSNCRFDEILSDTGNCFRTRKDAQKWIDFMESMKE